MEERHHLTFEIYEEGKITLEEYLSLVVFTEKPIIQPKSVSPLHVRAVKAFSRDDRSGYAA